MMTIIKVTENFEIDIAGNEEKIGALLKEVMVFCERVDKREVRSVKTYSKFISIIESLTGFTWKEIKELL